MAGSITLNERAFNWVLRRYEITLAWVLRHQPVTLVVTLSTIAVTIYLYVAVPKGFFPQQDTGRLVGQIIGDQDTSFQAMERKLIQYADIVAEDPAVEALNASTGGSGGGGGIINTGRMFVSLKPNDERKLTADEVIARLRVKAARVPGATLYLQSVQDLRIGGRSSASQYQYTLSGDNVKDLNQWAPRLMSRMRKIPGVVDRELRSAEPRPRGFAGGRSRYGLPFRL